MRLLNFGSYNGKASDTFNALEYTISPMRKITIVQIKKTIKRQKKIGTFLDFKYATKGSNIIEIKTAITNGSNTLPSDKRVTPNTKTATIANKKNQNVQLRF